VGVEGLEDENETNPFGRFTGVEKIEGAGEGVDVVDGETVANDTNPCGNPFGRSNVAGGLLAMVPLAPVVVAVDGDEAIGTNAFGKPLGVLGLEKVGRGPQSNETGTVFELGLAKVVVAAATLGSGLAEVSGAGLFLITAPPPRWLLFSFSLLPVPLPPRPPWDPMGSKWSSGKSKSAASSSSGFGMCSENNGPCKLSNPLIVVLAATTPTWGFPGELYARGAVGAVTAFVFKRGSFLTVRSALFNL